MPRRRFSQGAIKPIREMLQEIEDEENQQIQLEKEELRRKRLEQQQQKKSNKKKGKKKFEKKVKRVLAKNAKTKKKQAKTDVVDVEEDEDSPCHTDDDFIDLSREEQLERLKEGESSKSSGKTKCVSHLEYFIISNKCHINY